MIDFHIFPMGIVAILLLLIGLEDFLTMHVKTYRSYIYEVLIGLCIIANFYLNWQLAALLAVIGIVMYLVAIPGVAKLLEKRNFFFEVMDKEVFILTLVGFPFISMIAFAFNQIAFAIRTLIGKIYPQIEQYAAALAVYGGSWFVLACIVIGLYVH